MKRLLLMTCMVLPIKNPRRKQRGIEDFLSQNSDN